jgi:hypothetical protein
MVKRFLFTCAQNDTPLHRPTWRSLQTLAKHYNAQIVVSRYVYDLSYHNESSKPAKKSARTDRSWPSEIMPYVIDERMPVAKGLEWCGELQILPTAKRPISGFESYTGRNSCIIPHPKIAMESVASGKQEGTKLIHTTGCVTRKNYIQKKAGQIAQFHHAYGALLVEVNDRSWWFRPVTASENGTLYDLDVKVVGDKLTTGNRVKAIIWGDAHVRQADPMVAELAWGKGGILDTLRPEHQIFHDLLDFKSRNHHDIGNGRLRFRRFVGAPEDDCVGAELDEVAVALAKRSRAWCKSVVVASNHDEALQKWLDTADYRSDPRNALTFLKLQSALYNAEATKDTRFSVFEHAMHERGIKGVNFLRIDDSYIICPDANGGIELAMHGHLGVNGGKGSMIGFARMGRKSFIGHGHRASIVDGVWMVGTSSLMDLGYNRGPGAWSHTFGVAYPNGKRAMCTIYNGGWRA